MSRPVSCLLSGVAIPTAPNPGGVRSYAHGEPLRSWGLAKGRKWRGNPLLAALGNHQPTAPNHQPLRGDARWDARLLEGRFAIATAKRSTSRLGRENATCCTWPDPKTAVAPLPRARALAGGNLPDCRRKRPFTTNPFGVHQSPALGLPYQGRPFTTNYQLRAYQLPTYSG
ncbi:MAG: hypothetical protein ACHBN1_00500 [Heteroscytonema crispum UTEX LB 1556]